ncbi:hypothetical protein PVAG01_06917 [Phlyctema vagabunda]|uniref:Extracellular serine-rich protein n=1 Tax=Phlyctema vagabunda TaxID=108571 RepID=A0ABR4PHE7_9HELO
MGFLRFFFFASLLFVNFGSCIVYNSTALILGLDAVAVNQASYLLDGYAINYESYVIDSDGIVLPALESTRGGNYGLIVAVSQLQVDKISLLTDGQWQSLHNYQATYGVRMIHLNVAPGTEFGTESLGSCCENQGEQTISLIESAATAQFPGAGLRITPLSTVGLFHNPAKILENSTSTTTAVAEFDTNGQFDTKTVAGVINKFPDGREQMAFFLNVGNWSEASTVLGHAWINWGYRGTIQGYRRIYLGTQVDDLFLQTLIYNTGTTFRLRADDLEQHVEWVADLNSRLNEGSSYFTEFGFNANGNLIYDYMAGLNLTEYSCDEPVFPAWEEDTSLEYIKPLGTGKNKWPQAQGWDWKGECIFLDPLARFFFNISNRDSFGFVSHTFTHMSLNNATYHDANKEITFNLATAELMNFTKAAKFSGSGLIPPAITGLHNGDVIRAWSDNGLWNAVGDNTRNVLRSSVNRHWPLLTNVEKNGYDGFQITPRFATRIYYDCDTVAVNVEEWVAAKEISDEFVMDDLLKAEKFVVTNQLLSLYHDPYMFHQPNLRSADVQPYNINGVAQKLSLLQLWVEAITADIARLVTWPIITLKHDHIAASFNRRMLVDACEPFVQYASTNRSISGFTVKAGTNNTCEMPIPVMVERPLLDDKGFVTEQIGSDPTTIWVKLDGAPVTFEFS